MCRSVLEEDEPEGNVVDARSLLSKLVCLSVCLYNNSSVEEIKCNRVCLDSQ